MAPFPEAEIMTIKRLEVALRKMDFKLLKDGAYKLHEKYHAGHKFEYLDLLKDLLMELLNSPSVPSDIKDILCPTIEDILAQDNTIEAQEQISTPISQNYTTPTFETISKEEVSIITDEPTFEEDVKEEESRFEFQPNVRISAFDAFSPQKVETQQEPQRFFTHSPFSAEPFKEFNHPAPQINNFQEKTDEFNKQENEHPIQESLEQEEEIKSQNTPDKLETYENPETFQTQENKNPTEENAIYQPIQSAEEINTQTFEPQPIQEKKSIAIFYSQDNSKEKIKNIIKYKEIISQTNEKNNSIDDLMALISEITTQANTNTIELQGVLKQLSAKGNKTNLITNSQSEMLIELLDSIDITYSLFKNNENNKLNLLPLFGLSNLFYCTECGQSHLDKSSEVKPLVLECPQCKNPMYVDFWPATKDSKLNLDYYNEALINLSNSRVWLIIHPSFNDKISSDLIESALKISNIVEEIYVLDKDINTRENYKTFISKIKPNVKINAHNNTLEEFFKAI